MARPVVLVLVSGVEGALRRLNLVVAGGAMSRAPWRLRCNSRSANEHRGDAASAVTWCGE